MEVQPHSSGLAPPSYISVTFGLARFSSLFQSKPSPDQVVHGHGYHESRQDSQYRQQGEWHERGL